MSLHVFDAHKSEYGLTTANILYRMPDHPAILQSYLWQEFDEHPEFPRLRKFLDFWTHELEGTLHSVTVAHAGLVRVGRLRAVDSEFHLQ